MTPKRIVIAGAGLAGGLLAAYLGRSGHEVEVFEGRPDPRGSGSGGGRSINLALSVRGLHALGAAGLRAEVQKMAVPMRGRMLHDDYGAVSFQAYGTRPEEYINSVSRSGLNRLVVEAADAYPNVTLRFQQRVRRADVDDAALLVERGDETERVEADLVIGADGAFSKVRAAMQRKARFDYSQEWLAHGYKELTIPPREDGSFRMEPEALHIWPRGGRMMIALPNIDGSFTCTLFWPFEGETGFEAIETPDELIACFERDYPDALQLMPTLVEDFFANPTSPLVTVRCAPYHWGSQAVILGDAAHAIVPFYGQGANAAFEDCHALATCMHEATRVEDALTRFTAMRVENANAIADLALQNFVEMRDSVNSPAFMARKELGKLAHKLFPDLFLPLYTMVSFTRIPYAEALRRSQLQNRVALGAAAGVGVVALGAAWRLVRRAFR